MKHKINILIPIFIVLLLIYILRSFIGPNVWVETLRQSEIEDVFSTTGVVIKYETVLSQGESGVFEPLADEGERVSAGQKVAVVYAGNVSAEQKNKLEQINKKIDQIEKNQAELALFAGDVTRLEQDITDEISALIEMSQQGEMAAVRASKLKIEALCDKRAQILGISGGEDSLVSLRTQKKELEDQIGGAQRQILATEPGLFSLSVDGLEQVITPYNMMELRPSSLTKLTEQAKENVKQDRVSCKIMNNFRYFIALNLPEEKLAGLRVDDGTKVRFFDLSQEEVPVKVLYISPIEDGFGTVIIETTRHVDSLLKNRLVNLDFIKDHYSGYRVSVKCLRTKDDVTGVYVRRDDMLWFIPVTILYNTKDLAVVTSADSELPLKLYDEVVVSADSYEEGVLLR